jgi:hypothetical protein
MADAADPTLAEPEAQGYDGLHIVCPGTCRHIVVKWFNLMRVPKSTGVREISRRRGASGAGRGHSPRTSGLWRRGDEHKRRVIVTAKDPVDPTAT